MKAGLFLALLVAALGCGDSGDDGSGGGTPTGGEGGAGGSPATGGAGGGAPDPLGLDTCPDEPTAWPGPRDLPLEGWATGDAHAAMCALRTLDGLVSDRRVICSGENDHGVSESSRWHAHIARYLAHTAGVRVVALEATGAGVDHWNRYLETGDPADLDGGFGDATGSLADTIEWQNLVEALRAVRTELGEPIRLVGFDVAVQPKLSRIAVLGFVEAVAPTELAMWTDALPTLKAGVDWTAAGQAAEDLHAQIVDNGQEYTAATDAARWSTARRDAANLRDGYRFLEYYYAGDFPTGNAQFREPGMIRNLEEILAATPSEQRVLLVSHDMHCGKQLSQGTLLDGSDSPALGTHLAESPTWGPTYAVIAQLYEGGSHLANLQTGQTAQDFTAPSAGLEKAIGAVTPAGAVLAGTGSSLVAFDQGWSLLYHPSKLVIRDQFDGVLWIRTVTAATPR